MWITRPSSRYVGRLTCNETAGGRRQPEWPSILIVTTGRWQQSGVAKINYRFSKQALITYCRSKCSLLWNSKPAAPPLFFVDSLYRGEAPIRVH